MEPAPSDTTVLPSGEKWRAFRPSPWLKRIVPRRATAPSGSGSPCRSVAGRLSSPTGLTTGGSGGLAEGGAEGNMAPPARATATRNMVANTRPLPVTSQVHTPRATGGTPAVGRTARTVALVRVGDSGLASA